MPPKKGGKDKKDKKKKKSKDVIPEEFSKMDKLHFIKEIQSLQVTLERFKNFVNKVEVDNEDLKLQLIQLEKDRADVIAFLKRKVGEKIEEIAELTDRNNALIRQKETDTQTFNETIKSKDEAFKEMHEQLTSEIKLLSGKLNALEEFKLNRDDLMIKFNKQQKQMEDQDRQHKTAIYEAEKNFLLSKDKLRQEMEEKLLELSLDFQKATQTRIASTTQNVIRENIAINNELSLLIASWQKLFEENEDLKTKNNDLKNELKVEIYQKNKISLRSVHQAHVIDHLAFTEGDMRERTKELFQMGKKIQLQRVTMDNQASRIHDAERIVGKLIQENNMLNQQIETLRSENKNLNNTNAENSVTLQKVLLYIKEGLKLKEMRIKNIISSNEESEYKQELLLVIDDLLDKTELPSKRTQIEREASIMTVITKPQEDLYTKGDIGLVPKPIKQKPKLADIVLT